MRMAWKMLLDDKLEPKQKAETVTSHVVTQQAVEGVVSLVANADERLAREH